MQPDQRGVGQGYAGCRVSTEQGGLVCVTWGKAFPTLGGRAAKDVPEGHSAMNSHLVKE